MGISYKKRIGRRRKRRRNKNEAEQSGSLESSEKNYALQPDESSEDDAPLSRLIKNVSDSEDDTQLSHLFPHTNPSEDRRGEHSDSVESSEKNYALQPDENLVANMNEADEDVPLSRLIKNVSDSEDDTPLSHLFPHTNPSEDSTEDCVVEEIVHSVDAQVHDAAVDNMFGPDCVGQEIVQSVEDTTVTVDNMYGLGPLPKDWVLARREQDPQAFRLSSVHGHPIAAVVVTLSSKFPYLNITVHQRQLPENHDLYTDFGQDVLKWNDLNALLNRIDQHFVCCGNSDERFLQICSPTDIDRTLEQPTIRDKNCALLINNARCTMCTQQRNGLRAMASRKSRSVDNPELPSSHTPLAHLNDNQLRQRLAARTQENKKLKQHIKRLEQRVEESIETQGVQLDVELSNELKTTITNESPFAEGTFSELFWQQQVKAAKAKDPRSVKWHPMMIRWALSVKFKSSAAYETIRQSGLKLPSQRTLRDYTNVFKTTPGYQRHVFKMVMEEKRKLGIDDLYVSLMHDEVKLQSDLIFNKHTGELLGFVDLGDIANSMEDFERDIESGKALQPAIATHMLVLMIRGLVHKFEMVLAHFACTGIKAHYLFPILWEGVELLEASDVKVLCITCDGASPNRKFFKLHETDENICFKTPNKYAPDDRWLYFISDPPHLMKTTRNCFSNSYAHLNSRGMWRNGQDISWQHIVNLYNLEQDSDLKLVPKLTRNHVYLTSFARMKVSYATQVLSSTVANALQFVCGERCRETIKFVRLFDKFFDCLNGRSLHEADRTRKEFRKAYTSIDDHRFGWLLDVFLTDLFLWKNEVATRPGNYSKSARAKMLLSYQTMEGLEITTRAFVESCQFLLSVGAQFVLSVRYNQDPLEQWFSLQRSAGGANTNPTAYQFNYNTASLRLQRSLALAPFTGNCRRANRRDVQIDDSPLEKRKRRS